MTMDINENKQNLLEKKQNKTKQKKQNKKKNKKKQHING